MKRFVLRYMSNVILLENPSVRRSGNGYLHCFTSQKGELVLPGKLVECATRVSCQ